MKYKAYRAGAICVACAVYLFVLSGGLDKAASLASTPRAPEVNGNYPLAPREIEELARLARAHALLDVVAREGPAGVPRTGIGRNPGDWRMRVFDVAAHFDTSPHIMCDRGDMVGFAAASVYVEAIPLSHDASPEARFAYYYLDEGRRWRPSLTETPCVSIPANYYF